MKNTFRSLVSISLLMLSSCISNEDKDSDTDFAKDLAEFGNQTFNFLTTSTRAGISEFNSESINILLDMSLDLAIKYDLEDKIKASGYYTEMDEDFQNYSGARSLEVIAANSTPEFNNLLVSLVFDENIIDNNDIIYNSDLLPNEQIALIMVNSLAKSFTGYGWRTTTRADFGKCKEAYDIHMKECDKWLWIGLGLTVVTAAIPILSWSSGLFGAATAYDYATCSGQAMDQYMGCLADDRYDPEEAPDGTIPPDDSTPPDDTSM